MADSLLDLSEGDAGDSMVDVIVVGREVEGLNDGRAEVVVFGERTTARLPLRKESVWSKNYGVCCERNLWSWRHVGGLSEISLYRICLIDHMSISACHCNDVQTSLRCWFIAMLLEQALKGSPCTANCL